MKEAWLCAVGLRVRNLDRSIAFYRQLLDLEELVRHEDGDSAYVLLRDRRSGQRLELNWYARSSPHWTPYTPGEGLDHLEVRVKSVPRTLARLRARGIRPVTRSVWTNRKVVQRLERDPRWWKTIHSDVQTTRTGHRILYVKDPDGLLVSLYDHPEERWAGPVPDHY